MIVVYEPQCRRNEHVIFNSSLLRMLQIIYESETIFFIGDQTHINFLKGVCPTIQFKKVLIPISDKSNKLYWIISEILNTLYVKSYASDKLFFSSVTQLSVLFSKIFLPRTRTIHVFHGILEDLTKIKRFKPWNFSRYLKQILTLKRQDHSYIVLGKHILTNLQKIIPPCDINSNFIQHPYLLYESKSNDSHQLGKSLKIGTIGLGSTEKGINKLLVIEKECRKLDLKIKFSHNGSVKDRITFPETILLPSFAQIENRENYYGLIEKLDFCLFLYPVNSYRLTASGAIFDALVNIKPVIAIRNDCIQEIFDLFGDIGYLAEDEFEIVEIIKRIYFSMDEEKYHSMKKNIRESLYKITPEYVSKQLKELL